MSAPASPVPDRVSAISAVTSVASGRISEVGLGQRDHAVADAEQVNNGEMLQCLRHHAVIDGDDEQHEIDARRARPACCG